ncbi:MAG: translocation/assembly module TamB domain-containing protein [Bacteroidota bacterium]
MSTDPTRTDALSGSSGDGAASGADAETVRAADTTDAGGATESPARRRWPRRIGRAGLGLVAFVLLLGVSTLIYLQTDSGQRYVQGLIIGQIENLLADDATVTVESLDGSFLSDAQLTGLRIQRDGETVVSVDTVSINYSLRTLLRKTFSAEILSIRGPFVVLRQRADSSFSVASLFQPAEDSTESRGSFTIRMDELALTRGRVEVHWYSPEDDSVLVVSDLTANVRDFVSHPDSVVGTIQRLQLVATAPREAARVEVGGSGQFTRERLSLNELWIDSDAGTQVRGNALAMFGEAAGGDSFLPVFEADLEATPFAFSDVRAFTGVSLYGDPRARLRASSNGSTLDIEVNATLDEATAALEGELTRDTRGPVRYRADGTLRGLNLAELTGNPALEGELTGDLNANLQGTTLETLSGPFSVLLRESRFRQQSLDRVRLDGSFAAGQVRFDLDGDVPGASLTAQGSARPFTDVPSFQVAGTARDVNLQRLLPMVNQTAQLAGDFALVGRGTSLDTFTGTAAVSLGQALFAVGENRIELASADLDADIRNGVVDLDADAVLANRGGRATVSGDVVLGSDPIQYSISRGTLDQLDVSAITGNPDQASALTGTFTLSGAGFTPSTARIQLGTSLRNSRFGTYDLVAVDADATLTNGQIAFDTQADLGRAGAIDATGTARPFARPLTYRAEGQVRNLDLAELTGNPDRFSDLTGTFAATGQGIDPETLSLNADIALDGSSYGDRYIDRADVTVRLNRGDLAVDGDIEAPEGSVTVDLSGRLGDELALNLGENTCFSNLNTEAFSKTVPVRTDLNGCFTGTVSGLNELETADGSGVLTLRPSTINDASLESGQIAFTLTDGALGATFDLALGDPDNSASAGSLVGAVQARPFDASPTYATRGTARRVDVAALIGRLEDPARISLDFSVSGEGTRPETMTLDGRLFGGASVVGPVQVDSLALAFGLAEGVIDVDTLALNSDLATLNGGGTLALLNSSAASAFTLRGAVESLDPINAYTGRTLGIESGTLDLTASATEGDPLLRIDGVVNARELEMGTNAVRQVETQVTAQVDRVQIDSTGFGLQAINGNAEVTFNGFSTARFLVERGRTELALLDGDLRAQGDVTVDRRRDLDFAARFDVNSDPRQVVVETGRFTFDADTWTLGQEAVVTLGEEIDVRGLILTSDDGAGQIAADGTLNLNGEQSFIVSIEGAEIGSVADLFQYEELGGTLSAALVLSGPAAAPLIDGTLQLDELASGGRTFGALEAEVSYADARLGIDAVVTHTDGEELTVEGFVPLQFSLADSSFAQAAGDNEGVQLRAQATAFPIDWAQPFLAERGYSALDGTLQLDLSITGTQGSPSLAGTAKLSDGRIGLVKTGRTYSPLVAEIEFADNQIVIQDARVLNGGGRTALEVTGGITLRDLSLGEFDLTIRPNDFVAMNTPRYRNLTLDGGSRPLRLTGPLQAPVLRGAVVVASGDIHTDELVPVRFEDVELTNAQIREVESRFGRRLTKRDTLVNRFVRALDYDLTIQFRRNVWLRASSGLPFDIEFEGDVQATKRPFAEAGQVFGQIDLVRGTVSPILTSSEKFEVDQGTLTFNGPALSALIDLEASTDIRLPGASTNAARGAVTIFLNMDGQFDQNPEIRLSSDPQLEASDIVALIVTGQLADNLASTAVVGSATQGLLLNAVSGGFQNLLSNSLGLNLDLFQVETAANGDLLLRVGRYLGQRTFVTAGFPLSGNRQTSDIQNENGFVFTLEYQLLRWLQAQGEYGGERGIGGGLGTEYEW